jgi:hypothetical protein
MVDSHGFELEELISLRKATGGVHRFIDGEAGSSAIVAETIKILGCTSLVLQHNGVCTDMNTIDPFEMVVRWPRWLVPMRYVIW